jgi:hypothetical protein
MTRILLRFFNFPGLVLLTLIGMAIQTSLFSFWPLNYLQPDIFLLVVVWMALKRGLFEGGMLVLILSDFAEMHSAAPQGVLMITYMAVFLGVKGLARLIVIPNLHSLVMVTLFVSIFWKLSCLGVLQLLGAGGNQWRHTLLYLFPGAVIEGVLSIWGYRALEHYDRMTHRKTYQDRGDAMGALDPLSDGETMFLEGEGA